MKLGVKAKIELSEEMLRERELFNRNHKLNELPKILLKSVLGIESSWDLMILQPITDIESYFEYEGNRFKYRIIKWVDVDKENAGIKHIYRSERSTLEIDKNTYKLTLDKKEYYPLDFVYENNRQLLASILLEVTDKLGSEITITDNEMNING